MHLASLVMPALIALLGDGASRALAAGHAPGGRGAVAAARARPQAGETPAGLSPEDWRQIQQGIGESAYHAARAVESGEGPVLVALNPTQGYRATFRREGVELTHQMRAGASWRLAVSPRGYGYESDVRPLEPAEPWSERARIEYRRGPVTEWYVNGPRGLEQGFTIADPEIRRSEPIVLTLALEGDLRAHSEGARAVAFRDRAGRTRLRYAGLVAADAEGRPLLSWLEGSRDELRLVVAAQDARFPVTVDPTFVLEAELGGHGDNGVGNNIAEAGSSVSVSGDTAVVGAPGESAAHVFVRTGTTWTEQQKLVSSDPAPNALFGESVSVSGDTVVVGDSRDDTTGDNTGAAYVFVRSGTTWSQQQKLVSSSPTPFTSFASSVSVSGDTVVVGDPGDDAAYVFLRSGTAWNEQQRLLGSGGPYEDFGTSVAISANTAVIGAPFADPGATYVFVRSGTTWSEQQRLLAPNGALSDFFGFSVSVSADTAVIGAYLKDTPGGMDAGAAYVFVRSGTVWGQQQELLASDGAADERFGTSVSVSGDTAFIGAPFSGTGAAYVFVRSGSVWGETQKLVAPNEVGNVHLGASVAVDAATALVGAPGASTLYRGGGAAYVFVGSGSSWVEEQKLIAADKANEDLFGFSVSVDGDTALIGAYDDNLAVAEGAGSVYVFVRSGTSWVEQQKLAASDAVSFTRFGYAVALSGDTAVVGVYPQSLEKGAAYVFVRSGTHWTEQQKLLASDGAVHDSFGSSVSVSGDTALVGAYQHDAAVGQDAGSAYVFVRSGTTWSEQQELTASDAWAGASFGYSVAVSGGTAVVGAPNTFLGGDPDVGSAYVFVRSGTTWSEQQRLGASDAAPHEEFGFSVALWGDTAVIGAPSSDSIDPGSAYVFVRSGQAWGEQQELLASDGAGGDGFGYAVSVFGNTALIGAPRQDTPAGPGAGSAYVFTASGTTWSEQPKLLAPDGGTNDLFGRTVSVSGGTALCGAPFADTTEGLDAGSAYVFRTPSADLSVTQDDGQTSAVPGEPVLYTIVATNLGRDPVSGAIVADMPPAPLVNATWTCAASPGGSCTASGTGSINDSVTLPAAGTVTYELTATIDSAATGALANTVSVSSPPGIFDPDPSNDTATDTDTLAPQADLGVTKSDGQAHATPGGAIAYTIVASNPGPSDAPGATVTDVFPAVITGVTWTCAASGAASCGSAGGSGNIDSVVNLPSGGAVTFVASGTVDAAAMGTLVNTATVGPPAGVAELEPSDNSSTDVDNLTLIGLSELVHGTTRVLSPANTGPGTPANLFRLKQEPRSSYEIVVDGVTGDIASPAGTGPLLERLGADASTVLQSAVAAGAGSSRSLRFENDSAAPREDDFIRVESAGCTATCGPADIYRIRCWETTLLGPRFNNNGSQVTVLVLQNASDSPVTGHVHFWNGAGALAGSQAFSISAKSTIIVNTAAVPGVAGVGGSLTVSHDGEHGRVAGKTVAIEPATGFTFDTALEPRRR